MFWVGRRETRVGLVGFFFFRFGGLLFFFFFGYLNRMLCVRKQNSALVVSGAAGYG